MFGNASGPSRIYSYGAKSATVNGDLVRDQLHMVHRYKNDLVRAELERRDAMEELLRRHRPDLEALEAVAEEAERNLLTELAAVKERNASARKRRATPAERDQLKALRAALKDARTAFYTRRRAVFGDPAWKADMAAVEAEHVARCKRLRAESGLYWGNYLTCEQSAKSHRKGPPPHFRRWTGDGKLAVQVQGGMSPDEVMFGTDTRLRVDLVPGKKGKAVAWLRVGSEGREPIWAKIPFTLHRDLPAFTRVKWAYLVRRRVGTHDLWSVQFVVESKVGFPTDPKAATSGTVGVDLGWRRLESGGLRVAYWKGSDGAEGELVIPEERLDRWTKVPSLWSIRDREFDKVREVLASWLAKRKALHAAAVVRFPDREQAPALPEWLAEATKYLPQWRSPNRLASVVLKWRENRIDGDGEIFDLLETWRKHDKHLYDWASYQSLNNVRWRDDFYRKFASRLRRKYATIHMEDVDWSELQRRPEPDEESDRQAKAWARVGAAGRMREILEEKFGVKKRRKEAAYTTLTCHACGKVCTFDAATNLRHKCEHCGSEWDQDLNASANLLAATV